MTEELLAKAIAAHQAGQAAEAEKFYRDVLDINPDHADACALLGVIIAARGDFTEALQWAEKAISIDPSSALLRFHHGTILMAAQKYLEAVSVFARAIVMQEKTEPAKGGGARAHFHYNYANALRAADDWTGAIEQYRVTLKLDPQFLAGYNNLALSLVHERQYQEAFALAQQAVTLNPSYGDGWLTLCNVAEKIKEYQTALDAGERATLLQPKNHYAWFGYGVALNRVNRDAEAVEAYKKALALNPSRTDIWDNLAQSYQSQNRLEEAHEAFRKAVDIAGQSIADEDAHETDENAYGNRHWHLALIELLRGDYKRGFARYRARVKEIPALKRLSMPMPLWKGEDLTGKKLLVCDEQGYGDTLMLARFLPLLRAQNIHVVFSVHKVLEPYFRGWSGADSVIKHGDPVPTCDYFCSSFDLPHRLGMTLENLPQAVPYLPILSPDDATRLSEKDKIKIGAVAVARSAEQSRQIKIGVVWGGSPLHLADAKRSIPLSLFSTLFSAPNTRFYSFNRDLKKGDAELLKTLPVENLAPQLTDFAIASRFINQMDLVIACDTATAHLAGGMGKPVWILLPFAPDWRWLTNRTDSPWYPTARLFRQPAPEQWAPVIQDVRKNLN